MGYLDLADRSWPVLRRVFGVHERIYRATGGRIGRRIPGIRAPVLIVDHVGAKSGVQRSSVLLYIPDGENAVIIASKGGYPKNPAWLHNLRANPETTAQIGTEHREVHAREAKGEERDRLYEKATKLYPPYRQYQERTERKIPVIVLEPRTEGTPAAADAPSAEARA